MQKMELAKNEHNYSIKHVRNVGICATVAPSMKNFINGADYLFFV
jgi:hypothetical protein